MIRVSSYKIIPQQVFGQAFSSAVPPLRLAKPSVILCYASLHLHYPSVRPRCASAAFQADATAEPDAPSAAPSAPPAAPAVRLYCDLDGVLADFDAGVQVISGKRPSDMSDAALWHHIARSKNFFATLDWTPKGEALWHFLQEQGLPVQVRPVPRPCLLGGRSADDENCEGNAFGPGGLPHANRPLWFVPVLPGVTCSQRKPPPPI